MVNEQLTPKNHHTSEGEGDPPDIISKPKERAEFAWLFWRDEN